MKHFFLLAAFAAGTFATSQAQILEKTKVSVQIGYDSRDHSFNKLRKSGTCKIQEKNSIRGGFALDVPMGKQNNWLFETGLYYTRQGFDYMANRHSFSYTPTRGVTTKTYVNVKTEARGHALEVPILFGYQHNVWKLGLNLMLGGYVNYVIDGSANSTVFTDTISTGSNGFSYDKITGKSESKYDDIFNALDAGIQAEFGVRWTRLYVGVAYQYGFCDQIKENKEIDALKSSNLTLKVGFVF